MVVSGNLMKMSLIVVDVRKDLHLSNVNIIVVDVLECSVKLVLNVTSQDLLQQTLSVAVKDAYEANAQEMK